MGIVALAITGIAAAAAALFGVYEAIKYLNEKDQAVHPGQHRVPSLGASGKGGAGRWERVSAD
jgi:hypothetical protein